MSFCSPWPPCLSTVTSTSRSLPGSSPHHCALPLHNPQSWTLKLTSRCRLVTGQSSGLTWTGTNTGAEGLPCLLSRFPFWADHPQTFLPLPSNGPRSCSQYTFTPLQQVWRNEDSCRIQRVYEAGERQVSQIRLTAILRHRTRPLHRSQQSTSVVISSCGSQASRPGQLHHGSPATTQSHFNGILPFEQQGQSEFITICGAKVATAYGGGKSLARSRRHRGTTSGRFQDQEWEGL